MKIVFIGTSKFAVPSLEELIKSIDDVVLVISQPDKPKGRKLQLEPTEVKKVAIKHNKTIFQPDDINSTQSIEYIQSFQPDIIVVVSYGSMLCSKLRKMCPFGTINLHPSALPKHRGADPVRSTILAGDTKAGLTVFFVSAKMDAGNIISQIEFNIPDDINYTNLLEQTSQLGANLLCSSIALLKEREERYSDLKAKFISQCDEDATYSMKVDKQSNKADFSLSTNQFLRNVRSYSEEPGYVCTFRNANMKILEAEQYSNVSQETFGVINNIIKNKGFVISLKDGEILIKRLQLSGKKQMSAWAFHLGARLNIGERFENGIPD